MFTILVGIAAALETVADLLGMHGVASASIQVYLYGLPIWVAWLGIRLLRRSVIIAASEPLSVRDRESDQPSRFFASRSRYSQMTQPTGSRLLNS